MNLFKQAYLDALTEQNGIDENNRYFVNEVNGFKDIQVGVSSKNIPVILIKGLALDSKERCTPSLSAIEARFGVRCNISNNLNEFKKDFFNIIEFTENDQGLLDFFFNFFEELFVKETNKSANRIRNSIVNLSRLFSNKKKTPRQTMMGLWSELFIISISKEPDLWAEKWHKHNRATFDFEFPSIGIDVKSFGGHNREHFFAIEQLNNISVEQTLILSMCLKEKIDGENIFDLFENLKPKLKKDSNKIKVQNLLFKLAGKDIKNAKRFNSKIAKSTLTILKGKDIPRLLSKNTPTGVSEIKFKSDCSGIKNYKFNLNNQTRIEKNISI